MILDLPKNVKNPYVRKVENMLYIDKFVRFEELMYDLAYGCHQKYHNKCFYCGERINKFNRTMDHRYPRSTGGISLVNNLILSCAQCNTEKGIFTPEEYKIYKRLDSIKKKEAFKKETEAKNEEIRQSIGYKLPKEYEVIMIDVSKIRYVESRYDMRGKTYYKTVKFYNTYGNFHHPIVVDKNLKLLDGYNLLLFAIDYGIKLIPAIILENVLLMTTNKKYSKL